MDLSGILDNELKEHYKVEAIERPVFYTFPIGIRFEIGLEYLYRKNRWANKRYIKQAVNRCESIFKSLDFGNNVLLVFNLYEDEMLNYLKPLKFIQQTITGECKHEVYPNLILDDYEPLRITRHFFKFSAAGFNFSKLFKQIVLADMGGISELTSSVFIFDLDKHIMFYLYDDRGLDVVAGDTDTLRPIHEKYYNWILKYDLKEINRLFNT